MKVRSKTLLVILSLILIPLIGGLSYRQYIGARTRPVWHMEQISVSPDGACVVVLWAKNIYDRKTGQQTTQRVALYDLASGKRLSKAMPACGVLRPGYVAWSQTGHYFACVSNNDAILLFTRNGSVSSITGPANPSRLLWMPERTDTLVMAVENGYRTYHVPTGRTQTVHASVFESLFAVNGATCGNEFFVKDEIRVRQLLTGKVILRIPVNTYDHWDGPESLMVSPDGRFFQLAMYRSGAAFDMIARTADASHVLHDEHMAITWSDTTSGGNEDPRILWPSQEITTDKASWAMHNFIFFGTRPINATNGSDTAVGLGVLGENYISVDDWYGHHDYLIVTEDGLWGAYTHQPASWANSDAKPFIPATMSDRQLLE